MKIIFSYITLDLIPSLSKSSSKVLLLSPMRAQYLPCASSAFPELLPLFTYPHYLLSILNSIFLSSFLKQTQGNLIFLRHLYKYTAMAPDQSRWTTNVGAMIVLRLRAKQYTRRVAEHIYKGVSKSGQHYGLANVL